MMKSTPTPETLAERAAAGKFHICHAALLLCLMLGREASALMVPFATTTLVDRATCIVEGRVTAVTSHWTDDRSGIFTEVEVAVTDDLLGNTNRVTFVYQGGAVNGVGQRVSDMPEVTAGPQVLVFLRKPLPEEAKRLSKGRAPADRHVLVGAAQGVCRISGGRAVKSGFTVAGDDSEVDRNAGAEELKSRIRQRLRDTRRKGGSL